MCVLLIRIYTMNSGVGRPVAVGDSATSDPAARADPMWLARTLRPSGNVRLFGHRDRVLDRMRVIRDGLAMHMEPQR